MRYRKPAGPSDDPFGGEGYVKHESLEASDRPEEKIEIAIGVNKTAVAK